MSFLDQTGLGTFWAKLKSFFIPKLAPINILRNAYKFEDLQNRTKTNITIDNNETYVIGSSTVGGIYVNCTVSATGSVTLSNGEITLDFTTNSTPDTEYAIGIRMTRQPIVFNKTFTAHVKIKNTSSNILNPRTSIGTTRSEITNTYSENEAIWVGHATAGNVFTANVHVNPGSNRIQVTFYDMGVYEGEFADAIPHTIGLDASNIPLITDGDIPQCSYNNNIFLYGTAANTITNNARYKLFKLGKWASGCYGCGHLIITKSFSNSTQEIYHIEYYVEAGTTKGQFYGKLSIQVITSKSSGYQFNSASLVYDSSDEGVYLDVTMSGTKPSGTILINPVYVIWGGIDYNYKLAQLKKDCFTHLGLLGTADDPNETVVTTANTTKLS